MKVPAFMLKKLYVPKSLVNEAGGWTFRLKNTLVPATLIGLPSLRVDGEAVDPGHVSVDVGGETFTADNTKADEQRPFRKDEEVVVHVKGSTLPPGRHVVHVEQKSKEFDVLGFDFEDTI